MKSALHQTTAQVHPLPAIGTIHLIPVSMLHPMPCSPFKIHDDFAMQELVLSIKNFGILNPLEVRPNNSGNYEIISGLVLLDPLVLGISACQIHARHAGLLRHFVGDAGQLVGFPCLEAYVAGATNKYVTVTGKVCEQYDFGNRTKELQILLERFMVRPETNATNAINAGNSSMDTAQLSGFYISLLKSQSKSSIILTSVHYAAEKEMRDCALKMKKPAGQSKSR